METKTVLITGAGASTSLGKKGAPLPLMPQLSRALYDTLEERAGGLARAMLLEPEMTGEAFETALGNLFAWRDMRPLNFAFRGLSFPSPMPDSDNGDMAQRRSFEDTHLALIVEVIDEVLFRAFGREKLDDERARDAYSDLLSNVLIPDTALACATTNYDASLEVALQFGLKGSGADVGIRSPSFGIQTLQPGQIELWGDQVPVLHLHGAVGWVRDDESGNIIPYPITRPNGSLGRPALLYPDPNKDPAEGPTRDLWDVFKQALEDATHVFVLGHSLHDPPLVDAINVHAKQARVGVFAYTSGKPDSEFDAWVEERLPGASIVHGIFGPDMSKVNRSEIAKWRGDVGYSAGTTRPVANKP